MKQPSRDTYTVVRREETEDFMAQFPGYGEMRSYTAPLGDEQVGFSWRRMPEKTGGKGSYGHRHENQEEVYVVISGTVQFKVDDDVIDVGPGTAVRVGAEVVRSVWNDGPGDAELIIMSPTRDDPAIKVEDFWPVD
ncbi:MAG TPA: cupin domain-containing protein [Solirubrobacterales bacterium]|nr:cupin domain-containing protein [Solirubrobacterales bacterium]